MSRLGDLIRTERLRQKMTLKQVAKKTGVSEGYLQAVEAGTRIIADDQARRILKTIGLTQQTEADFTLDDIASTVDLVQVAPQMTEAARLPKKQRVEKVQATDAVMVASTDPKEEKDEAVTGSIWLDALQSVLKRVPIMNAVMKPVDYRLVPIINNRIEGAAPDKVFYYMAPDDSMRGFRIHSGDLALMVPAQSPVDGSVMLVEHNSHRYLRKIKRLDDRHVMLQSYDREYDAETVDLSEAVFLGRAVKLEITL